LRRLRVAHFVSLVILAKYQRALIPYSKENVIKITNEKSRTLKSQKTIPLKEKQRQSICRPQNEYKIMPNASLAIVSKRE